MRALAGLAFLSLCQQLAGFRAGLVAPQQQQVWRTTHVSMGSAAAMERKGKIVDEVKEVMADSTLMFCVRSEGIPVNELNAMRQKLPETVTMRCVKNTLVKRAVEDYPNFQGGDDMLHFSNYWFFVPEDQMRPTVDLWTDFVQETKKEDNDIVGGMFEGQVLDKEGVIAVTKLPTKQELMQQTAVSLKALPTKLAHVLHEAGAQRLARVTKQASGQKLVQAVKAMEGKKE
jgi:large subunit ribosomal protein L10